MRCSCPSTLPGPPSTSAASCPLASPRSRRARLWGSSPSCSWPGCSIARPCPAREQWGPPRVAAEDRLHRLAWGGEDHPLLRHCLAPEAAGRERGHGEGSGAALAPADQPEDLARGPDLD